MNAYDSGYAEEALILMEACARNGDPVACYLAALWCSNGEGTRADEERAQHWMMHLEQIAHGGDLEAQWEIGQHYRFGDLFPLDLGRANYWLERAAEGGYGEAQHHLAWFYETGQYGYPVDINAQFGS
jgi:TPR repeat protein